MNKNLVTRRPFVVYKAVASQYTHQLQQQLHINDVMSRSFKVKIIRATDIEEALPGDPYVKAFLVSEKADSKPVKLHKTRAVKEVRQINDRWFTKITGETTKKTLNI